jgi:hypothetical protein
MMIDQLFESWLKTAKHLAAVTVHGCSEDEKRRLLNRLSYYETEYYERMKHLKEE